jgi:hypothetical protein
VVAAEHHLEATHAIVLRRSGWRLLVVDWRKNTAGRWTERVIDVA